MTVDDPRERLRALAEAADADFPLGEAALTLAALDRPQVPLDRYRDHLRELAASVDGGDAATARAEALAAAIAGRHRYQGDALTYDDLQNANMIRVMDRRKGLPVALGILYIATARRLGWEASGIAFPGHFLIAVGGAGGRAILDPFHGGRMCAAADLRRLLKSMTGDDEELEPAHYAPVSDRSVLLRLHNNVKLRRMRVGDVPGALAALEAMLLFAPAEAALWHEAALIHAHLGSLGSALEAAARALEHTADPAGRHRLAVLQQELRSRLN